jgi:hypothetical protein
LSFQLNGKTQWYFEDKMSRCIFIFRRGDGPQHIHSARKKQATALRTEAMNNTAKVERSSSLNTASGLNYLFSPSKQLSPWCTRNAKIAPTLNALEGKTKVVLKLSYLVWVPTNE